MQGGFEIVLPGNVSDEYAVASKCCVKKSRPEEFS